MSQYHYYQVEGGEEAWKIVPVADIDKVPKHMYRTILSIDTPPTDNTTKEAIAAIKFAGPLYFDLDDKSSPASTAKHLVTLIDSLLKLDVQENTLEVYASGGKGFHMLVPAETFIEKVAKTGYQHLPHIYKEMAFELAVPYMDFVVYSGRKGRMFRMPNVLRPNKLYKVQVTVDEVREIAKMPNDEAEAYYKVLCSTPRDLFKPADPVRAFGLQALFDSAKKKVEGAKKKAAKQRPVDLPDDLPSFEAMLRGEGICSDAGFHPLAMQIAITAHARGMSQADLIEAAEGLIQNHAGDGNRYNTPSKRRYELMRMMDYTEDNPCYSYSAAAIRALLSHNAPDLAGVAATQEEIQEGIDNPDESDEYDHAGVMMTSSGVSIPAEGGYKKVLALNFSDVTEMVSSVTGNATVLQAKVSLPNGKTIGNRTFELDQFNSASSLNKGVMPMGQIFAGNDAQARGVYLRLVEKARKGGRRVYVLNREGVDIVTLPFHVEEEVRKGVVVFADREMVLTSKEAANYEDFRLKFVGFPDPLGIYKSDLSMAPRMQELSPKAVEELRDCLWHFTKCQTPEYLGKLIGWTTACHYRMMFHKVYDQFPLLHVNGAAGAGKTSMVKLAANLHYYRQEPKVLTPSSTNFAIKEAAAASASIPLIIDEYKPHVLNQTRHDEFKMLFRDAYNCRETARGGGNRDSSDYRSIQTVQLAAPICFVAEATETEPAVMERVILLTLVKPSQARLEEFFGHFTKAKSSRHSLGVVGAFLARTAVNSYSVEALKSEFDLIYESTRKELMLQPGEAEHLSFAERKAKAGAKERTAFNYAVLRFGLLKFKNLAVKLLESDENGTRREEILEALDDMITSATSSVEEVQHQTVPEWLRVLNTLADMANGNDWQNWSLHAGRDFAVFDNGGQPRIELNMRTCYSKYRFFCSAQNDKPLFPSEIAFTHALRHLPSCVQEQGSLDCIGGSLVFDLDDLRLQGFIDMPTKKGRGK